GSGLLGFRLLGLDHSTPCTWTIALTLVHLAHDDPCSNAGQVSRVPSTPSVLATIAGLGDHFMAVNVGSTLLHSTRTNEMVMVDCVGKLGQGPKSHNFSTGLYNNSKLRACFRGRCATIQG